MTLAMATADSHWDESSPRWPECQRIHGWIADQVEQRKPDVFLHAGDLYERRSTPRERQGAAAWLMRIADVCPVVMVRGNHDAVFDLDILRCLRTRHPIIVEEQAAVHHVAGIAVACLSWPRRAELRRAFPGATTGEAVNDVAREQLRNVLRGMGDQLAHHDGPTVLLAHAMVDGSVTSTGQPLVGQDMNVSLDDLALARASVTVLGHIHKPQEWLTHDSEGIYYTGSPFRTAFGETEAKSILSIECDPFVGYLVNRIYTPTSPMLQLDGAWDVSTGALLVPDDGDEIGFEDAEVRLRYRVPADCIEAAAREADSWRWAVLDEGARSVKLEPEVIATTRSRTPEIAAATTLTEKLDVHWSSKGVELSDERRERLKERALQLEEEVRCAG